MSGRCDPEQSGLDAVVAFVTENYFSVLGVKPVLGRDLTVVESDDPGAAAVAVVGYRAWDQLYGGSPDVVGSTVRVNGVPVTVLRALIVASEEEIAGISFPAITAIAAAGVALVAIAAAWIPA